MSDILTWILRIGSGLLALLLLGVTIHLGGWLLRHFGRGVRWLAGSVWAVLQYGFRRAFPAKVPAVPPKKPSLSGLPGCEASTAGELSVYGIWALAQAVHEYCRSHGYPHAIPMTERPPSWKETWLQGLRLALERWHAARLWLNVPSSPLDEGASYPVYLSQAEYDCCTQSRHHNLPSRHGATLDVLPPWRAPAEWAVHQLSLAEALQTWAGATGLVQRLEKKNVAPFEAIDVPPLADEAAYQRKVWTWEHGNGTPLALPWPDLSDFCSEYAQQSPVLFPREWGGLHLPDSSLPPSWGCRGSLHFGPLTLHPGHTLIVRDTSGKAGVLTLLNLPGSILGEVVGYWLQPCQWEYLKAPRGDCQYWCAAQKAIPDPDGEGVCDLVSIQDGKLRNPAGVKILAGTYFSDGYVAIQAYSADGAERRVDWLDERGRLAYLVPTTEEEDAEAGGQYSAADLRWRDIHAPGYKGLIAVQCPQSGRWGFIDRRGQIHIEPQFHWVGNFQDKWTVAQRDDSDTSFGMIDTAGRWILAPYWRDISVESESFIVVQRADEAWGAVNIEGREVIPFRSLEAWGLTAPLDDEQRRLQIRQMEELRITALRDRVQAILQSQPDSLAALAGVIDAGTTEPQLRAVGLWGLPVQLIADKTDGALRPQAGETGFLESAYPVSLSTFDLRVEAPVMNLASCPQAVVGISWGNLASLPSPSTPILDEVNT